MAVAASTRPNAKELPPLNCTDALRFCKEELRVTDKRGQLVPLVANRMQEDYSRRRTRRNIVLKMRQGGMSTIEQAHNYFDVIRREEGQHAWLLTHRDDTSRFRLQCVRTFYLNQPKWDRPDVQNFNEHEITFPGMRSSYYVATAGGSDVGVGVTITKFHASELPFWPGNPENQFKQITAAIPPEGTITIESCAGVRGDYFHRLWQEAKRGENEYTAFFYPWWWTDEYQMAFDSPMALPADRRTPLEYSDEEVSLINQYGLLEPQIRWRRWAKQQFKDEFPQKYPEDDVTCFLHAGRPRFQQTMLDEMIRDAPKPIMQLENGAIRIYEHPFPSHYYAMGADTALGMLINAAGNDADDSAFHILDLNTNKVVAAANGRWRPSEFARILNDWGRKYNTAFLAPERNSQGEAVLQVLLEQLFYPNLYYPVTGSHPSSQLRPGWFTSDTNKYVMEAEIDDALRSRQLNVPDKTTLDQLMGYQRLPDGKTGANKGEHDDLVTSLCITYQMRKYAPIRAAARPVNFSQAARGLVGAGV